MYMEERTGGMGEKINRNTKSLFVLLVSVMCHLFCTHKSEMSHQSHWTISGVHVGTITNCTHTHNRPLGEQIHLKVFLFFLFKLNAGSGAGDEMKTILLRSDTFAHWIAGSKINSIDSFGHCLSVLPIQFANRTRCANERNRNNDQFYPCDEEHSE